MRRHHAIHMAMRDRAKREAGEVPTSRKSREEIKREFPVEVCIHVRVRGVCWKKGVC